MHDLNDGGAFGQEVPTHGILGVRLWEAIKKCVQTLKSIKEDAIAHEIIRVCNGVEHSRFAVAVVGEFGRGKSTLINNLLGRAVLPIGDLPTTAILTKIEYGKDEKVFFIDSTGKTVNECSLSNSFAENLSLHHFGGVNFSGFAEIRADVEWLNRSNLVIYDTPGAGDLADGRGQQISDMLLGCDGVIVTISATAALSQSEHLFLEERVLSRSFSAIIVALTKLDQVRPGERGKVVDYVKAKLQSWKIDIPVVPVCGDDLTAISEIRNVLTAWAQRGDRIENSRKWIRQRITELLQTTMKSLQEQRTALLEADEKKRDAFVNQKRTNLDSARLAWCKLNAEMQNRSNICYKKLLGSVSKYSEIIREKLEYEVRHTNDLEAWVSSDLSYRIKVELANMATSVENFVTHVLCEDVKWYNEELTRIFRTSVHFSIPQIISKEDFDSLGLRESLTLENLDKKRTILKIGSAVLAISGAAFLSSVGCWPLVATMGVGTVGGIFSEKFIRGKIEEQRRIVQEALDKQIPQIIQTATAESEKRLLAAYDKIIEEGSNKENLWLKNQRRQLDDLSAVPPSAACTTIAHKIEKLNEMFDNFAN